MLRQLDKHLSIIFYIIFSLNQIIQTKKSCQLFWPCILTSRYLKTVVNFISLAASYRTIGSHLDLGNFLSDKMGSIYTAYMVF